MAEAPPRRVRVAVDIGGTFTDLQVLEEESGRLWEFKTPTTPDDPSIGLAEGLSLAAAAIGFARDAVELILHGTTIATNAVLEHRFPDCALITTAGFEDVLEIGRHMRRDVYGLYAEDRPVLLPRPRRFGVPERIASHGNVAMPLDEAAACAIARRVMELGVAVVAVCTLHAYANPVHERRLRDILLAAAPRVAVSLSSEVSPEIREYERMSTTVLNALLMPVVRGYMSRLQARLESSAPAARVLMVQSNGGVCGPRKAGDLPAGLLLSGPSGGALAVEHIGARLAMGNLVGIDMGGTSFDVTVVQDGRAAMITEGRIEGFPVRLPMTDIRTIGTGGGSIAWIDRTGRLRIGPQSAGAQPGPACYGRGGDQATVTDANLVLGRIDAQRFLGGAMALRPDLARAAIERDVCRPLGLGLEEAADGIVLIAVASMAQAIRLSLFERGLDPGDFALVSFGGAGGLHAAAIAEEAGVGKVVFPRAAGTLSAFGILSSDIVHNLARSRVQELALPAIDWLAIAARELRREADTLLGQDRVAPQRRRFAFALDLRYRGQGYELTVPLPDGGFDADRLAAARERFDVLHEQRFAHADRRSPVEAVALRLTATGELPKPTIAAFAPAGTQAPRERRPVYAGGWAETPVFDRAVIGCAAPVVGPTLIEEDYSTILLPRGWRLAAAATGDLVAERTP
jgi:N-methylhydantoinase A